MTFPLSAAKHSWRWLALALLTGWNFAAIVWADSVDTGSAFYQQRGITFYAPMDGEYQPAYSRGAAVPGFIASLEWTGGRDGRQALWMRPAVTGGSSLGSASDSPSGLVWPAAGLLYGEAGTLSYWVRPDWAAGDPSTRVGPAETGPLLINVSSLENAYYNIFMRAETRGTNFYLGIIDGDGDWHGLSYKEGLEEWKAGQWQHVVLTWDANEGMRFYNNGELKYSRNRPFSPLTPWKIAFSGSRPMDRPAVTRYFGAAYQDVVMLDRMVTADEVVALQAGELQKLRSGLQSPARDEEQIESRRQALFLEEDDADRIVLTSHDGVVRGSIRQLPVETMDLRFINAGEMVNGHFHPRVRFAQGGLEFERTMKLFPAEGELATHLYIVGRPGSDEAVDAFFKIAHTAGERLPSSAEVTRARLLRPADQVEITIPGGSEVGELLLYHVATAESDLNGYEQLNRLGAQGTMADLSAHAESVGRRYMAEDRVVLVPGRAKEMMGYTVPATAQIQLASAVHEEDCAVQSIRLALPLAVVGEDDVLRLRVYNPFTDDAHYMYVDVELDYGSEGDGDQLIDLVLSTGGMIFPQGSRTVVEIASRDGFSFNAEPRMGLEVAAVETEAERFGKNMVRNIKYSFAENMAWNFVFLRRGVETENDLTRALDVILRFAPENELAQQMQSWAPLVPWPSHTLQAEGPDTFPAWARYARMATKEARDVIHWWIDQRQDETGYLVGRADPWNDDTKLFNEYSFLGLIAGDQDLVRAIERFLEAHWKVSGHMEQGWSRLLTDIVHSGEEANYLQPALALLRYGEPVYMHRLMETAANIDQWTAINHQGHRHFKSNYYTASQMRTDGSRGYDVALNATAMIPTMYLAWYSRHPVATRQLLEWADGWLSAVNEATADKRAGEYPAGIHFETGEIQAGRSYPTEISVIFAAAYYLSGDAKYLQPMLGYLKPNSDDWIRYAGVTMADVYQEAGAGEYERVLLETADKRLEAIAADHFFQRGLVNRELPGVLGWQVTEDPAYLEATVFEAWRNNYRGRNLYTIIDPHKDRVYPWGRLALTWMYLGGNALNARGSGPWPSLAVSWDDAGYDFSALVTEKADDYLQLEVFNFAAERMVTMRVWSLDPGLYRLSMRNDAGEALLTEEHLLFRGETLELPLLAESKALIQLEKIESLAWSPKRADLALSRVEPPVLSDDELTVTVYNIGSLRSEETLLRLEVNGKLVAEERVAAIDAPLDFQPQFVTVTLPFSGGAAGTELVLTVDPDEQVAEITRQNNRLVIQQQ